MGKNNKEKKQKNAAESSRRWRTGQLNKNERKAMERYGLDVNDYAFEGQSYRHQKGSYDDMQEDFTRAARNDYDTRRGIEAMAMSGKKKAKKLAEGGLNSAADVMNANNMQMKEHRRAGNGGDFSSASDFAGTSYRSVERDRKKQTESYQDMFGAKEDINNAAPQEKEKLIDVVKSDELAGAERRLEQASSNPSSLYSKNNTDAPKADDQKDAARSFLDQYKLDVGQGAGLKQDTTNNLKNAAASLYFK